MNHTDDPRNCAVCDSARNQSTLDCATHGRAYVRVRDDLHLDYISPEDTLKNDSTEQKD